MFGIHLLALYMAGSLLPIRPQLRQFFLIEASPANLVIRLERANSPWHVIPLVGCLPTRESSLLADGAPSASLLTVTPRGKYVPSPGQMTFEAEISERET